MVKLARWGSVAGGLDRGDPSPAHQLVEGEQGPVFLLKTGLVTRAKDVTLQGGVPRGQVGGLDLFPRS